MKIISGVFVTHQPRDFSEEEESMTTTLLITESREPLAQNTEGLTINS
jgi:hypothetical protein